MLFNLFLFAIKSSLVLCILYGAYHFLFKNNTNFHTKRALMLVVLGAALSLPLIEYRTHHELAPENPSIEIVDNLETGKLEKDLLTKKEKESGATIQTDLINMRGFDWLKTLTYVYGAGVILMFGLFLLELTRITWVLQSSQARHDLDRLAITHKSIKFPFSFWRWIFLPTHLDYNPSTWKLIQEHERVHLQEGHSLDVFIVSLAKCLFWFNPVIYLLQKSMKDNHEALADRSVLKDHSLTDYSKALLEVCLQTGSLNLGHSFALKSNLARRLKTIDMSPTKSTKTIVSLFLFMLIGFGVFTQTSMYGQNTFYKRRISSKDIKNGTVSIVYGMAYLSPRHQVVMNKLKALNPDKKYRHRYVSENHLFTYSENETPQMKTEFFGRLSKADKQSIYDQVVEKNVLRKEHLATSGISEEELDERILEAIGTFQNYILIYEWLSDEALPPAAPIFEMDEVDVLPEPLGGLENFQRTVALDIELPSHIDKSELPDNIEFSFVVAGANHVTHIDLITELEGDEQKQKEIYKSFRLIHDSILGKVRSYYSWKRGMKDGKKVNVRMVVSIPTKYL